MLLLERIKLGGCKTGQAKITGGRKLSCKCDTYIVRPRWKVRQNEERELPESRYRESLRFVFEYDCQPIAFPHISSVVYGCLKDKALKVAVDCITEFLIEHNMLVYLVVFDRSSFQIS